MGWGWLTMAALWVALVAVAVLAIRALFSNGGPPPGRGDDAGRRNH